MSLHLLTNFPQRAGRDMRHDMWLCKIKTHTKSDEVRGHPRRDQGQRGDESWRRDRNAARQRSSVWQGEKRLIRTRFKTSRTSLTQEEMSSFQQVWSKCLRKTDERMWGAVMETKTRRWEWGVTGLSLLRALGVFPLSWTPRCPLWWRRVVSAQTMAGRMAGLRPGPGCISLNGNNQ